MVAPVVPSPAERAFPIVVLGHVDHGKSTLIGRLLVDTGAVPAKRVEELRAAARKRGLEIEWSFLLDALQIERDQGITLDRSQAWFNSQARRYTIIDAPGHVEFLRNMVSGAAAAEGAVLVVDATQGVQEQTRRHALLTQLLGIREVVVVLNKMDALDFDAARHAVLSAEVRDYLATLGVTAFPVVPVSARDGDNVLERSARMPWYGGPTIIEALDQLRGRISGDEGPLRLPVQDIYREGDVRYAVGRIEAGRLRVGDRVRLAPTGREAVIREIGGWGAATPRIAAVAGQSVALAFDGEPFVERGHVIAACDRVPVDARRLDVRAFWLDREPLSLGASVTIRIGTAQQLATVSAIDGVMDVAALQFRAAHSVGRNEVARLTLILRQPIAADRYVDLPETGRGTLMFGGRLAGGFVVDELDAVAAGNLALGDIGVTRGERAPVLWLTGLSGSGKSTLAFAAAEQLRAAGQPATVLDGDLLRAGINSDLGFAPADRRENLRRTAHVARLLSDAGVVTFVALISPYAADRRLARDICGDTFREVHVAADVETCRQRDPKGLYARAAAGALRGFTGVDAPYEAPEQPDLLIDTSAQEVAEGVVALINISKK